MQKETGVGSFDVHLALNLWCAVKLEGRMCRVSSGYLEAGQRSSYQELRSGCHRRTSGNTAQVDRVVRGFSQSST